MSSPATALPRGDRPSRGPVDHAILLVLILIAAGLATLLFEQHRRQGDHTLRALLDDQRQLNARLSEQLSAGAASELQTRFDALLSEQHRLRGDIGALNTALAGVMVERDQLRERLERRAQAPALPDAAAVATRFSTRPAVAAKPLELQLPAASGRPIAGTESADAASADAASADAASDGTESPGAEIADSASDGTKTAGAHADKADTPAPVAPQALTVAKNVPVLRDIPGKGLRLQEIHFSPASSTLSPGAVLKARQAAELFRQQQKNRIRLVGFSDTVGDARGNQRMSERRAAAVAKLLVSAGVPRERIDIVAKGEQNTPLLTGDGVDEPLNRCVGIFAVD